MADDMITIDASALSSFDYSTYISTYYSTVGTAAGTSSYYGGTYTDGFGYYVGSQVGYKFTGTTNTAQVVIQGENIAYDGIYNQGHGISGDVDGFTLGYYTDGTTFTQDDVAGTRSELTGVVAGLVVSGLGYSAAVGTGATTDNMTYQIYNALRKANDATSGATYIAQIYDMLSAKAQHFIGSDGIDNYTGTDYGDLIEGGTGADTLAGGLGDDTYIVTDFSNTIVEAADGGTDTIKTALSHLQIAANVENLVQTGTASTQWNYGNELANTMTATDFGAVFLGMGGNDTLIGGAGDDVLDGRDAKDPDTGESIMLGDDVMIGGLGNDTYGVDSTGDTVTELAGQGTDTVITSLNYYQLGDNVENLTLLGTDALHGYGNELNNVITGNSGSNILAGLGGNDTLDGGVGADSLYGGAGNDIYIVDNAKDVVSELDTETNTDAGGKDTVRASVSYKLGAFVENLQLIDSASDSATTAGLVGKGNGLANRMTGGVAADTLYGLAGNDLIWGGKGADSIYGGLGTDTLTGGAGADTFFFKAGETSASKAAADTITDFLLKQHDVIDLHTMDANSAKKGNQDFDFIGTDAFSKHAGELRFEKTAQDTYIMGDTNGDGKADFTIHLDGAFKVTDDFFVL